MRSEANEASKYHRGYDPADPPQGEHETEPESPPSLSFFEVTHVRPDGTRVIVANITARSLGDAKRKFKRGCPQLARRFRPFTVKAL